MSDVPFPYHRISADLRSAIETGELAPGARLPSEWALARRYGASRPTVRRAVAALKAEGLVVTEQGRGTFVRPLPPVRLTFTGANFRRHRRERAPGFDAQVREQGRVPEQRLLDVRSLPADAMVADRLQIAEGEPVMVRRRLFLVDQQAIARCDSYYRASFVEGTALTRPARIPGGAMSVIEDPDGPVDRRAHRSVDELTGRMPSPAEAQQLGLSVGLPVVCILRTIYDDTGMPLELQETVAAADRHEFRYEVNLR